MQSNCADGRCSALPSADLAASAGLLVAFGGWSEPETSQTSCPPRRRVSADFLPLSVKEPVCHLV